MNKQIFIQQYVLAFMANFNTLKLVETGYCNDTSERAEKLAIESAELEFESLTKLGLFLTQKEKDVKDLIFKLGELVKVYEGVKISSGTSDENTKLNALHMRCHEMSKLKLPLDSTEIKSLTTNTVGFFVQLDNNFKERLINPNDILYVAYNACHKAFTKVIENQ